MPQATPYKKNADWRRLNLYRKADALYQLTAAFCHRFLQPSDDPAADQMLLSARNGKQNIVQGSEGGTTSPDTEIKLITVARNSITQLRENYQDYLHSHDLILWGRDHPRFIAMLSFCRQHNDYIGYAPLASQLNAEEFCNLAVTLCHIIDKMMNSYLQNLEHLILSQRATRERAYAPHTPYRQDHDEKLRLLEQDNSRLQDELQQLTQENKHLQDELSRLQNLLSQHLIEY